MRPGARTCLVQFTHSRYCASLTLIGVLDPIPDDPSLTLISTFEAGVPEWGGDVVVRVAEVEGTAA